MHSSSSWFCPSVQHLLCRRAGGQHVLVFFGMAPAQEKRNILYFKTSSKSEHVWHFPSLSCVPSTFLVHQPQTTSSSCTPATTAVSRLIAYWSFLPLFLHTFPLAGIFFLFSNVMTFLCYCFWHIRCKRYWTRLIFHSFLQIKRLLNYLELSLCQHIPLRATLSFSLVS